jgi:hypothetical protein
MLSLFERRGKRGEEKTEYDIQSFDVLLLVADRKK